MRRALPRLSWADAAWACVLGALLFAQVHRVDRIARADPDRAYHHALSRLASDGPVTTLPQVEGLGWNERFDEKEWLFHQLGGPAWRVDGESGVDAFCFALGWLDLVLVYLLCRRAQGPAMSALLVVATCLASSLVSFRLTMVRPHLAGLACALLLVHGLLSERRGVVFAASVLFALSYHALFLPLALVVGLALRRDRATWRWPALVVLGLVLGTVVSPAFPGNAWSTWVGWKIAWTTAGDATSGAENLPLPWLDWLRAFGGVFVGALFALRGWKRAPAMVWVMLGFWLLTLRMPRAGEYAVPLTAVALAFVVERDVWKLAVPMLLLSLPGQLVLTEVLPLHTYTEGIARSVEALPANEDARVFNCSFADGAYLLERRPRLHFIDVLDPMLLKVKNAPLAAAREAMWKGEAAPYDVLRDFFPAKYVVCGYLPARAKLEADPRFRRLHPPPGAPVPPASGPPVYELLLPLPAPAGRGPG